MTFSPARIRLDLFRLAALGALTGLAACSGGGGGSSTPVISSSSAPVTPASGTSSTGTFEMSWGSAPAPASVRRPKYLAPTALSASLTVVSSVGSPIVGVLNNPSTTLQFTAPNGLDTFLIQTYDEPNGVGNVLSEAYVTQTVSSGSANIVAATLNAVVTSLALTVSPLQPVAGAPSAMTVSVTGFDADRNVVVGSFASPIQLAINDPAATGTLSLSPSVLQSSGTTATLNYTGKTLISATVVASVTGGTSASVTIAPTPGFTSYPYASGELGTGGYIVTDHSDNLWFTEPSSGHVDEFLGSSGLYSTTINVGFGEGIGGIAAGVDGNIWFSEVNNFSIFSVNPATGAPTQHSASVNLLGQVAEGGDGTIWFTSSQGSIGYITESTGGQTLINAPAKTSPLGVAQGPDGLVYFTSGPGNNGASSIFRIAHSNGSSLPVPGTPVTISSPVIRSSSPGQIIKGPDGNMWFVDGNSTIGKVTPGSFTITEYPTLTPNANPYGITAGADGALWFTENVGGVGKLGRITTSGVMTEYSLGTTSGAYGITSRANGSLWIVTDTSLLRVFF